MAEITMYDDVNLTLIPPDAQAVAGYVNGRWPNFPQVVKKWPHAEHLSIAVTAEADADCLDIENGDATPDQAPVWVHRQLARGMDRPAVYCSLSIAKEVLDVLAASGISSRKVRLITAHYTEKPHICSAACGYGMPRIADGTQWTDKALGRSLDESLLSETFFVTSAMRRRILRAWILAQRGRRITWADLKKTSQWERWRKLGGH